MKEPHFLYLEIFIECNDKFQPGFSIYHGSPESVVVPKKPGPNCSYLFKIFANNIFSIH